MWTNPSQKSRQGADPPPHSGNACILGASGPGTPPLARPGAVSITMYNVEVQQRLLKLQPKEV